MNATRLRILSALVAATMALAGCSSDDAPEAAVIEIAGLDYGLSVPEGPVVGGNAVIAFENAGEDIHHLQMWRVDDADAAADAIRGGDLGVLADATAVGGVGAISGGASHRVASNVPEGEYVVFCVIETPAGAHHELGMVSTLTVEGDSGAEPAEADTAMAITVDGYDLPDEWDGAGPLEVTNDNRFPSDAEFLRLVDGATKADFLAFISGEAAGPPPFTTEGGVAALAPGATSVVLDDVRPGTYLVASFAPNPTADMAPQFLTGHLVEFTIG